MTAAVLAAAALVTAPGPQLLDLRVTNGSAPFAGDGAQLTTVSPNNDGFRDLFGGYGIEIDARTAASPPGTRVPGDTRGSSDTVAKMVA